MYLHIILLLLDEYSDAELIGIIDVPSWHEMFKTGRERTCQYVVKL